MLTPHTPRYKNSALAIIVLCVLSVRGIAQDHKLQPLASYEQTLRQFHRQKLSTDRTEFATLTKRKWWYYLPQVGFNLGLPSINGGTNQMVQLDIKRQQDAAKIAGIESTALFSYRLELEHLRVMYAQAEMERSILGDQPIIQRLEGNIFSIHEEAHKKEKIKPIEYIQQVLAYQLRYIAHDREQQAYQNQVLAIEQFSHYQFPAEVLNDSVEVVRDSVQVEKRQVWAVRLIRRLLPRR